MKFLITLAALISLSSSTVHASLEQGNGPGNGVETNYCQVVSALNASELNRVTDEAADEVPGATERMMVLFDIGFKILEVCGDLELVTPAEGDYCKIVPELNAKELTQASSDAANDVPGAFTKASALLEIGFSLQKICK